MVEQGEQVTVVQETGSNVGKWILLLLALIYAAGSLYFLFDLRGRLDKLGKDQTASQAQIADLSTKQQSTEAATETLGQQLGITKKELAERSAQLQASQRAAEARLSKEQKEAITQVSGEVAGVKTDVGGVKTDVATNKAELDATKAKLESTIGDLGLQSGLIAKTRDDLETLKHRGDRNYYEFTLLKGAKPQPVSTVSLQLKKTDAKKGKYTMNVTSDDKTIEKKDRNQNEPVQFYSGRDHMLYELVVWTVDKSKVTGYVSTPKNAPVPVTATPTAANTSN
jgi:multidrug efflux pump subunit AcrA (membrane-fusion protein)